MLWAAIQKYSNMAVGFISGIVLARLLTPYDYGCIGMLSIFMVLSEAFIDGGFGSALIQKKNPTQTDYSTIFWWNLSMAFLFYLILYFTAPLIAQFYKIPELCDVLRVQGLILFTYSLNIIQRNQLRKKLKLKILATNSIITSVISLIVTIVMAYNGFGVWSLVVHNILNSLIPTIFFWFYVRWRPRFVFSWASFRELFSFGLYVFLTHLVERFASQLTGLVIGKVYNPQTLGYYSKALRTERIASYSISSIMTNVTYPLYAEVQDDKARVISMIKRMTSTVAYATFPVMFMMILVAKPLFILLYSDRWLQSIPYFQVLCIAGLAACLQSINLQAVAAVGKSKTMFTRTVLKRVVGSCAMIGGLFLFGMKGLLIGVIINAWFSYLVNILMVSKHIGYKSIHQLMDIFPIAFAAALSSGIAYLAIDFFGFNMYLDGALKLIVCVTVYVAWSLIFKPESYRNFISVIPKKFRIWEKNKFLKKIMT